MTPMEPAGVNWFSWKRLSYFLTLVAVAQCLLLYHNLARSYMSVEQLESSTPASNTPGDRSFPHLDWEDEAGSSKQHSDDGFVDALTAKQCDLAFPDLYHEIDRGVKYWRDRKHTISEEDLFLDPEGSARFLIHRNEIRVIKSVNAFDHLGMRERIHAVTNLFHRALESASAGGEMLPTIEFTMSFLDFVNIPAERDVSATWAFARVKAKDFDENRRREGEAFFLVPNFDLYSVASRNSGAFRDFRFRASQYDSPLSEKIPQAIWRGSAWTNSVIREGLINKTRNATWASVENIEWDSPSAAYQITSDELCAYYFAIHTEGLSYSGRLSNILNCDSLPIVHDLAWTTHYYHLLEPHGPKQNFISVKRDWSDLEEKVQYYFSHPEEADRIRRNAVQTFREQYLTRAATSCYIRKLIREYAKIAFKPESLQPWLLREGNGTSQEEVEFWGNEKAKEEEKHKAAEKEQKLAMIQMVNAMTAEMSETLAWQPVTVTVTVTAEDGAPQATMTTSTSATPEPTSFVDPGVDVHNERRANRDRDASLEQKGQKKQIMVRRGISFEEIMYLTHDFEDVSEFYPHSPLYMDWQERAKEKEKGGSV